MNDKEIIKMGLALARHIMQIGDTTNSPAKRIQFMGGYWPDDEEPQGGLCESALSDHITTAIREHLAPQPTA